jgi:hypothetical protein
MSFSATATKTERNRAKEGVGGDKVPEKSPQPVSRSDNVPRIKIVVCQWRAFGRPNAEVDDA